MSADGRFVAFSSDAWNLVPGDTNGTEDVFVYDRLTKVIERVSIGYGSGAGDRFGCSVSISGSSVFVGARRDDDNGIDSGSAYVFQESGSDWSLLMAATLFVCAPIIAFFLFTQKSFIKNFLTSGIKG